MYSPQRYPGLCDPDHADALTGLPNSAALLAALEHHLAAGRAGTCGLAVLALRLDGFGAHEPHRADRLVAAAAERLTGCVRMDDLVVRRARDEFALLLDPLGSPEVAASVARKICGVFARGFKLDGSQVSAGASIGISVFPHDGVVAEELVERADRALARAARYGDCFLFDDDDLNRAPNRATEIRDDPRSALDNHEFYLEYQPRYSLRASRICGAEALIRWQHPQRGTIPPDAFIPLAESTGLIHEIGDWVLECTCRQAATWAGDGIAFESVSANVSGRQLDHPDLPDRIDRLLQRTRLPPERLQLELTESALMQRPGDAAERLRAIRSLGVELALDDFGSGYSSLGYLLDFPLDVIKIDRAFIARIEREPAHRTLVGSIISLARGLGLRVVAEGVETESQLEFLREADCDEVQGFLIGHPAGPASLVDMLLPAAKVGTGRTR